MTDLLIEVANFIRDAFYVDDGGGSVSSEEKADELTQATDKVLATVNMKVKGWTKSFRPPNPDVRSSRLVEFCIDRKYPLTGTIIL